jgi:hypothetical protein
VSRDRRLATAVRDDAGAGRTAIEPWANPISAARLWSRNLPGRFARAVLL